MNRNNLNNSGRRPKRRPTGSGEKNAVLFKIQALLLLILFFFILVKLLPSFERVDFKAANNIPSSKTAIIHNGAITDTYCEISGNDFYLPFTYIKNNIDPYIFFDEAEQRLTITTEDKVIRMKNDELDYYINEEPFRLALPFYITDSEPYMPLSLLTELYGISLRANADNTLVSTNVKSEPYYTATVKQTAFLRSDGYKKAPYFRRLKKGEVLTVFPDKTIDNPDYYYVLTSDNLLGYISKSKITIPEYIEADNIEPKPSNAPEPISGKVSLTFDQITNYSPKTLERLKSFPDGVNVVSPTWFSFENTSGDIRTHADRSYVDAAHENGIEVWALITDNFNSTISHSVLSSAETRSHVIKQLLAYCSLYDLDGINIDFEAVPSKDGDYFVQFIRELAPLLHKQGARLSIDTFVPKSWTQHYNRSEISKSADYIIVMGYDEHHASSTVSGSVASIGWSEEAISATLAQGVAKEKLVLGIPFYTRLWTEELTAEGVTVTNKAYGMKDGKNKMEELGGTFKWLASTGQYYSEVTEGSKTYKMWLEEAESVKLRLELAKKYDISGVASWKRGFEYPEIWTIIKAYVKSDDK